MTRLLRELDEGDTFSLPGSANVWRVATKPTDKLDQRWCAGQVFVEFVSGEWTNQGGWWNGSMLVVEPFGTSARKDAEWLEQTLPPSNEHGELSNALAVLIVTPKIRAFLEANDPKALEQAREALGLPEVVPA